MKSKIIVIGDVMLDHYIYGSVDRICPEAPVPVLEKENENTFVGAAGLVASNLRALGTDVALFSVIGDDAGAGRMRELLAAQDIPDTLSVEKGRKTTLKERFIATSPHFQMLLRTDSESRADIKPSTEADLLGRLGAERAEFLILADYNKGVLTPKAVREAIALAGKKGMKVIVDTKKDLNLYKGAYAVVPNVHELCLAFAQKTDNDDPVVRNLSEKLGKSLGCVVVVKRGAKGASILADGKFRTYPALAKAGEIVNVSGAGDIFVAILTIALASGKTLDDAVKLANVGCAKAIAKQHPSISREELPELG
jgi:D-beta-D-heptose 7-phosphate kinase/D-beta-D-heptose 1-phosphate adenosyltransferase